VVQVAVALLAQHNHQQWAVQMAHPTQAVVAVDLVGMTQTVHQVLPQVQVVQVSS
jgi:hypothetical protein